MEASRYFWALVNLDNCISDPRDMEWMVVWERHYKDGAVQYDICGSDEGLEEDEIVVWGPTVKLPQGG